MKLQPYRPADLPACVNVFHSNVPEYFHANELDIFVDCLNSGTYLPPRLRNTGSEAGRFYVLAMENAVLGCGGWYLDGDVANLSWGMIARGRQRRGLGTALLEQRIERVVQHGGAKLIRIRTSAAVQAFYVRNGFTIISQNQEGLVDSIPLVELVRPL